MRSAPWLSLVRIGCLAALAASGALVADYVGATAPTYCTAGSGCASIRQSGWGHIPFLGYLPVPVFGAVAFALLLGVTLLPNSRLRHGLSAAGGVLSGVIALALLYVQAAVLGAFCSLCVVVDVGGLLAGAGGVLLLLKRGEAPEPLPVWSFAALGLLAFMATWYWPKARPAPDVPPELQKLYVPGKINVVEFADFECPHCRRLQGTLKQLQKEYEGRVNLVLLNFPLASHPLARDAARAHVCAAEQGQGPAMAGLLFEGRHDSEAAQKRAARELGLDVERFERCLSLRETDLRIDRQSQILRNAGFDGLPTTYVGSTKIIGAQPIEVFRAAFERAERGSGASGVPWPVYSLIALGAAVGIVWLGRREQRAAA